MRFVEREVGPGALVVALSDIHGNVPAFEAVLAAAPLAAAELIVVHGDVVNRGPRSDLVWDLLESVRDERWIVTSGNHERYVATHLTPGRASSGVLGQVHHMSRWTFGQMGGLRAERIADLSEGALIRSAGHAVAVVHASMESDDRGLSPMTPEGDHAARLEGAPELVVVGHVHRRYDFWAGDHRVVNAGSVGFASDGVHEAGWTELRAGREGWQVSLQRVPYDVKATARDFAGSGYLEEAGIVARLVHREWELARPVLRPWMAAELERVLAGEVELSSSVESFLRRFED